MIKSIIIDCADLDRQAESELRRARPRPRPELSSPPESDRSASLR
jgi:hypothetical protein